MIDCFRMSGDERIIHVLDEEALVRLVKVSEEAWFGGALCHAYVFKDCCSVVVESACSLLRAVCHFP